MGLEERCRYVLAAEAIAEEQGIDVDIEGLEEEVERAKQQCKADKVDFDPDVYRIEMVEKLRYAAVMQWLQQNLKVEVLPWGGAGAAQQAAEQPEPASV
jgi:alanyl-tRNA synthetase